MTYGYQLTRICFWCWNFEQIMVLNTPSRCFPLLCMCLFSFIERHLNKIRFFKQRSGSLYLHNLMHITIKKNNCLQGWLSKLPLSCFWYYLLRLSRAVPDKLSSTSLPLHFEPYGALPCACVFLQGLKQNPKTEN